MNIKKKMKLYNVNIIYLKNGMENVGEEKERGNNIFEKVATEEECLPLYIGHDYLDAFVNTEVCVNKEISALFLIQFVSCLLYIFN